MPAVYDSLGQAAFRVDCLIMRLLAYPLRLLIPLPQFCCPWLKPDPVLDQLPFQGIEKHQHRLPHGHPEVDAHASYLGTGVLSIALYSCGPAQARRMSSTVSISP